MLNWESFMNRSLGWSGFGALLILYFCLGREQFRNPRFQAVRRKQPWR